MAGTQVFGRVVALVTAGAAVAAASAALAATADPSQMALRPADLPGAKVAGRAPKARTGYVSSYERSFDLGQPYGRSHIVYVSSGVEVAGAVAKAKLDLAAVRTVMRSSKGREQFAAEVVKSAGKGFKRKDLTVGKPLTPQLGDEAVELPLTLKYKGIRVYTALTWFRVDRVLSLLYVVGARAVVQADIAKLTSLVVAHVGEQFVPVADAPPTISGTAQQGQTLTATSGTWSNSPSLGFQWQHCDAAGASCIDVPGATTATYVVASTDAGATLRVVENGTNRFGTASMQSVQTAVVT